MEIPLVARETLGVLSLVAIPALVAITFRVWSRSTKKQLSAWRNRVGAAGLVLVAVDWLFLLSMFLFPRYATDLQVNGIRTCFQ